MSNSCSSQPIPGSGSPNGVCWYSWSDEEWKLSDESNLAPGYSCRPVVNAPPPEQEEQDPDEIAFEPCVP